jgi:DNA-binding NarL/FixJ family response regulator
VLLVDDHGTVRDGLRELLAEQPQLEVVGEAADGFEALAQCRALRPDVVLMDVSMPRLDGIEATRRVRAESPGIQVLGLSTEEAGEGRHAIEAAGATAYFSKNEGVAPLIARLLEIQAGLDTAEPPRV